MYRAARGYSIGCTRVQGLTRWEELFGVRRMRDKKVGDTVACPTVVVEKRHPPFSLVLEALL